MKRVVSIMIGFLAMAAMANAGPSTLTAAQVIEALKLVEMPDEACPGFYRVLYTSPTKAGIEKPREAASLIYYMMTPEVPVDPWHIIDSDEVLLYHAGAPMIQILLYPDGTWEELRLGAQVDRGEVPQKLIPAGTWMGFVLDRTSPVPWGLYGVMVVPGWHIEDIRMADEAEIEKLMRDYPGVVERGRALGLFPPEAASSVN